MVYEKLLNRLIYLIENGQQVLLTRRHPGRGIVAGDRVKDEIFFPWKAGSLSFLKTVFGDSSTHFQGFQEACKYSTYNHALQGQSILIAAKEDMEGGYLKKLETLVAADIFTDFLEMAEYLVNEGYKDPAASLVGAVLEDGLRKIARNNDITIKSREDINSLNQKLADAGIYNRIIQKRVQVWNDIRNNADHGNFSEYDLDLVKEMLGGVRDFLAQYL
ncbi:hypothetical protein ES703_56519 [subsurface metagenome]